MVEEKMRDFIICPVRESTEAEKEFVANYVSRLENAGCLVHNPPRDTKQDGDPIGLRICTDNREAVRNSRIVRLYFNPTSQGTYFDLGMTFMENKPLFVLNPEILANNLNEPMSKFLFEYAINTDKGLLPKHLSSIGDFFRLQDKLDSSSVISYEWKSNDKDFLFNFGMAFMAGKPIILTNRDYVETQRTPHKSFQNVLLELDFSHSKVLYPSRRL
jgi:hypothetical protein